MDGEGRWWQSLINSSELDPSKFGDNSFIEVCFGLNLTYLVWKSFRKRHKKSIAKCNSAIANNANDFIDYNKKGQRQLQNWSEGKFGSGYFLLLTKTYFILIASGLYGLVSRLVRLGIRLTEGAVYALIVVAVFASGAMLYLGISSPWSYLLMIPVAGWPLILFAILWTLRGIGSAIRFFTKTPTGKEDIGSIGGLSKMLRSIESKAEEDLNKMVLGKKWCTNNICYFFIPNGSVLSSEVPEKDENSTENVGFWEITSSNTIQVRQPNGNSINFTFEDVSGGIAQYIRGNGNVFYDMPFSLHE